MAESYRARIPFESLDPLTIGAADDESKIYRDEPEPVADATGAAREALESPVSGRRFSELLAGASSVAVVIDNQFRPTPASKLLPPVFDALEFAGVKDAVVVCANG